MRHPGVGVYRREQLSRPLRMLAPTECLDSVVDVDLKSLWDSGKRLILLDVDNTLLPWKATEIPTEVLDWLKHGRSLGFEFCILSNTRHPERLAKLSQASGVPAIRDKFKPSPRMYELALERFNAKPEEAVMVGDQLLTDVLGANRCGIDAYWVKKVADREFVGTAVVSRNIERVVASLIRHSFQSADAEAKPGFFQRGVVRQLLKFGVVGGTATVVDLGLHRYLMFTAKWGDLPLYEPVGRYMRTIARAKAVETPELLFDAAFAPLKVPPVMVAILFSYILNLLWTFRGAGQKASVGQAARFYAVAIVGMVISVGVSSFVNRLLHFDKNTSWALASLAGIAAGFVWNFNAQRLWTFRSVEPKS